MALSTVAEDQLVQAQIDAAMERREETGFSVFKTGDPDIDRSLEKGGMALTSTASGRVTIYDTDTGEPREILDYMLAKTLRKKRAGKPAFSVTPLKEFKLGTVMCYLHPKHPERELFDSIGLAGKVCGGGDSQPAAHLASNFDRDLHMKHRHGREWGVIQEYRERTEKEQDREIQRQSIAAMMAMAERQVAAEPQPSAEPMAIRRGPGRPPNPRPEYGS